MQNILITCLFALLICSCNQPVAITPDPSPPAPGPEIPDGNTERNEALIGLWKNTEILGTGEFTMTNEMFIEFSEDGSVVSWPGRSVGPDYYRDEDKSKASKCNWYTSGNSLHMIDPATNQDAETYFTVSGTGLLMSNGSQKKPFVRIK